ncbi:MAG: cardiolipin synthase B [Desulfobacteraceae bacterium]|nr:MAG: cardiolipin synthase B [Desulfobacteraceae bacterium]
MDRTPLAKWLFIASMLISVAACMRSLPEGFRMPPEGSLPDIRVQGMPTEEIWPHLFGPADPDPHQLRWLSQWIQLEQQITGYPLVAGNHVQLLIDGPMTLDAMFDAMARARHHIHLETFIISDDPVGQRLAEILIERRRSGVEVRLIIDAVGALEADEAFLKHLREQDIEVHKFHPIDPSEDPRIWRINTRHHRKVLIVDGRVGFLGGINISGVYAKSSYSEPGRQKNADEAWRDTHMFVEGPVVAHLQELFVTLWAQLHDSAPLRGSEYFPDLREKGRVLVRLANNMADDEAHQAYRVYMAAFHFAQKTIWITQGYFSPDRAFLEALKTASRRGVDVRLLLPGITDSWITISSSRAHYDELLSDGVRIFERKDVLQHAKTAVVDGMWSLVGSTNLDYRSLIHSNEANLMIWGRDFGEKMENLFLDDQSNNQEITLTHWRKRPFYHHLLEVFASMFDYWL